MPQRFSLEVCKKLLELNRYDTCTICENWVAHGLWWGLLVVLVKTSSYNHKLNIISISMSIFLMDVNLQMDFHNFIQLMLHLCND